MNDRNSIFRRRSRSATLLGIHTGSHTMSQASPAAPSRLEVLRLPDVCRITGLCRSSIYQLEAEQRFPHRIKVGTRSVGWIDQEVQEWLATRVRARR